MIEIKFTDQRSMRQAANRGMFRLALPDEGPSRFRMLATAAVMFAGALAVAVELFR